MLNLFKSLNITKHTKGKEYLEVPVAKKEKKLGFNHHFPSSSLTWFNNIYSFNRSAEKSALFNGIFVNELIKKFFDLIFNARHGIYNTRSMKKVFSSKVDIKHFNNKVVITVFTYNRAKEILLENLLDASNKFYSSNDIKKNTLYKKFKTIQSKYRIIFSEFFYYSKLFKNSTHKITSASKKGELSIILSDNSFSNTKKYKEIFFSRFIKKPFTWEIKYLKYYQTLMNHAFKFDTVYLYRIKDIVNKVYNKKIEFNIINLKDPQLDISILSDIAFSKIENNWDSKKKHYKKPVSILKELSEYSEMDPTKFYEYNVKSLYRKNYNNLSINNIYLNSNLKENDIINTILNKIFVVKNTSYPNYIKDIYVYRSIKLRKVRGIRWEINGRITRRFTASRSTKNMTITGSSKNVDSSINGLSSPLIKNHMSTNIQYSNINWATRSGAYGFKGWIATK